ncbi:hypothetical protein [Streptomyces sp. RPT161]|nr:hypothetical protein [Streptomyces sp. RPT161]
MGVRRHGDGVNRRASRGPTFARSALAWAPVSPALTTAVLRRLANWTT